MRSKLDSALRKYKIFGKETGVLHHPQKNEHVPRMAAKRAIKEHLTEPLKLISFFFFFRQARDALHPCSLRDPRTEKLLL